MVRPEVAGKKLPIAKRRGAIIAAIILVAIGLGMFLILWPNAPQRLSADVYPLYPGVAWGADHPATHQQFSGYEVVSQTVPNVTSVASVTGPFEEYYQQKLVVLGWSVDNSQAAAGPGSEAVGFKKGDNELIFSYSSVFHSGGVDSPVQCPCDVTMQIFSGSKMHSGSGE